LVEISKRTTGFSEPKLTSILHGKDLIALQHTLAEIPVPDPVAIYAARLVLATHPEQPDAIPEVKRYVAYGSSPRGLQSLIRGARIWAAVRGATNVSTDDIIRIAKVALRHRIILNFEGEAQQVKVDDVIDKLLVQVKTPAQLAM
jgi:MoxR-like ATPase